jgi:hypothetical protein
MAYDQEWKLIIFPYNSFPPTLNHIGRYSANLETSQFEERRQGMKMNAQV